MVVSWMASVYDGGGPAGAKARVSKNKLDFVTNNSISARLLFKKETYFDMETSFINLRLCHANNNKYKAKDEFIHVHILY